MIPQDRRVRLSQIFFDLAVTAKSHCYLFNGFYGVPLEKKRADVQQKVFTPTLINVCITRVRFFKK
jgi:hypothetical protein